MDDRKQGQKAAEAAMGGNPGQEQDEAATLAGELAEYAAAWDDWSKVDAIDATIEKLDPKTERELLDAQTVKKDTLMQRVAVDDYRAGEPAFDPWAPLDGAQVQGQAVPVPPPAPTSEPTQELPDAPRRLAALRVLGGNVKWIHGEWRITGIDALETQERDQKRKRTSQKTIRADLKEAAEAERKAKREGPTPAPWHP